MHLIVFLALSLLAYDSAAVTFDSTGPHVYVANVNSTSCTIAWGTTTGKAQNTIGFKADGIGPVTLQFGDSRFQTAAPWYRVDGLKPDTTYTYQLLRDGKTIGSGSVRTWPEQANKLTFIVIGDWGNASSAQFSLAGRLEQVRKNLENSDSPVRFVLSTGDNIYGSGTADRDWGKRFFVPYASTLSAIPFYAVLGNHDGNESESASDLNTYLDNFFSPGGQMTRWYHFQYANYADFFALDSTTNQPIGKPTPAYLAQGEQSQWLAGQLKLPLTSWRFAFLHHPMFTAGPNHPPALPKLRHWFDLLSRNQFTAVFSGHEHNLQISERNDATGNITFLSSGAGGELRKSDIRKRMPERHIAAWSNQVHFLLVELNGAAMKVTPYALGDLRLLNPAGQPVAVPIEIPRRQ